MNRVALPGTLGGRREIVLDAITQQLWSDYLRAEQDRIRDVMLSALDRFIRAFVRLSETSQREWALHLASDVADQGADIPVRFPLFERVLLPVLAAGVADERPGCARWLAHFESQLMNAKRIVLPDRLLSAAGLLLEALRVDPLDRRAREGLVRRRASYLRYTLHELPAGVLYGHNGATLTECDELLAELADFREHVDILGDTARFAALIDECALHFPRYREYLASGRAGDSYERFLASHD